MATALQISSVRITCVRFATLVLVLAACHSEVTTVTAPSSPLTGRWRVTSIVANGQLRHDPELMNSIWAFDPPRLVVRDASNHETVYDCVIEDGYVTLTQGSMKYALDAQGLRLAFFDGLKGKPESFQPEPGRADPLLLVVRLMPVR